MSHSLVTQIVLFLWPLSVINLIILLEGRVFNKERPTYIGRDSSGSSSRVSFPMPEDPAHGAPVATVSAHAGAW